MSKSDDMAKLPGLYERGGVYQLRVMVPDDLQGHYGGRTKVIESLQTRDRREAERKGTTLRAQRLDEFESIRRSLNPQPVAKLAANLGAILAGLVRSRVLAANDDLRANGAAILSEVAGQIKQSALVIGRPRRALKPASLSPLDGLTDEQLEVLTGLNAAMDGKAAIDMAGLRLSAVVPLVDEEARKLGMQIEWRAPEARPVLLECLSAYRQAWADIVRKDAGAVIVEQAQLTRPAAPVSIASGPAETAMTLRAVFEKWKPSKTRKAPSTRACELALDLFESRYGAGLSIHQITRVMGDEYRGWLLQQQSSSKTARDRFTWIKSLLLYAYRDLELIPRQPWARLDIAHRTEARRRPWKLAELQAFFGLPIYTAYEVPHTTHAGADAAYWIPLLGLYSGATVSELAQMRTQDVDVDAAVPTFGITDEGEGMTTKNAYRVRAVPIHSELIRLGFLDYAREMQERGEVSMWPALKLRKDKPGGYFSEWFGETRRAAPLNFEKYPDFHCFRHSARTAMAEAGFDSTIMDRVTGHTAGGSAGNRVYTHPVGIIKKAVEAIQYPGLVLPVVYAAAPPPPRTLSRKRRMRVGQRVTTAPPGGLVGAADFRQLPRGRLRDRPRPTIVGSRCDARRR